MSPTDANDRVDILASIFSLRSDMHDALEEIAKTGALISTSNDRLHNSIELLSEKIEQLCRLHERVIKWLLIVVCAIALGRAALDLVQDRKIGTKSQIPFSSIDRS